MTAAGSSPGSLRKSFIFAAGAQALIACAAVMASPAHAGDWSFDGNISNSVEVFDNFGLLSKSDGVVIRDALSFNGDLAYTTHTSRFDLISSIVANGYAGSSDSKPKNNILPSLNAKYHVDGKRTSFDFGANYAYVFLPAEDGVDPLTGLITEADASARHSFGASFGVQHKVNPLNTISFTSAVSENIYTGAGDDNFSFNSALTWNHILSKRLDTKTTLGVKLLDTDDAARTQTEIYTADAALTAKLSKRLTGNVGAGVNLVNSEKTDLLLPGTPRSNKTTIGYSANAGFQYTLKTFSLGGNASYGLQGTSTGDIRNNLSFGLNASQAINARSNLSAFASAQFTSAAGGTTSSGDVARYSFGPTYSYQLAKDWNVTAGYKFTLRDADGVSAKAHNAFLTVAWKLKVK